MAITYESLLNYKIPEVRQTLRWQDVALYNFSIGLGQDPMDERQLDFLYEPRLKVMPSMPVVLGAPGFWSRNADTGIDWVKIVHGEQGLILHRPLPVEGEVIGRSRVTGLVDRGPGKGALMYSERQVVEAKTGALLATLTSTSFLRGDGGSRRAGEGAAPGTRPCPGCGAGPCHPAGTGAGLSPEQRPQPPPYRPKSGRRRRVPPPHPAWALHLRHGLPRAHALAL